MAHALRELVNSEGQTNARKHSCTCPTGTARGKGAVHTGRRVCSRRNPSCPRRETSWRWRSSGERAWRPGCGSAKAARTRRRWATAVDPQRATRDACVIVHNSTAGEKRYDRDSLMRLIRTAGHDTAYFSSDDDAWTDAVDPFADIVAAAGGDGTVGKVAQALQCTRPACRLLCCPWYAANNISRALGQAGHPARRPGRRLG